MGNIEGLKQVSIYVDPKVWQLVQLLIIKRNDPTYVIVNEALATMVEKELTPAEMNVFGYKKGAKANGAATRNGKSHGGAGTRTGKAAQSGPGAAKRKAPRPDATKPANRRRR